MSVILPLCVWKGYESGEAPQCGDASLHGPGGDVLEHPHVPLAQNLWVQTFTHTGPVDVRRSFLCNLGSSSSIGLELKLKDME